MNTPSTPLITSEEIARIRNTQRGPTVDLLLNEIERLWSLDQDAELERLRCEVYKRDAVISAQDQALAHWRREVDRNAGELTRLREEVRDLGEQQTSLGPLLADKREWSLATFGPNLTTEEIVRHIRKECDEILEDPSDLSEHIDVMLLAMDLYWRAGGRPEELLYDLWAKHRVNRARRWKASADGTVEHVRGAGA